MVNKNKDIIWNHNMINMLSLLQFMFANLPPLVQCRKWVLQLWNKSVISEKLWRMLHSDQAHLLWSLQGFAQISLAQCHRATQIWQPSWTLLMNKGEEKSTLPSSDNKQSWTWQVFFCLFYLLQEPETTYSIIWELDFPHSQITGPVAVLPAMTFSLSRTNPIHFFMHHQILQGL